MAERVIPRSADPELPLLVVVSYDRAGRVTTLRQPAFAEMTQVLVVHDEEAKDAYELIQDCGNAQLFVSGVRAGYPGSGKVRQMQWVWDQLDEGEVVVFADDDIKYASAAPKAYDSLDTVELPADQRMLAPIAHEFREEITPKRFRELFISTLARMNSQDTIMGGFAVVDNYFFRLKHWRRVGYVSGHMIIMRKDSRFRWDEKIPMEDYRNSAEVCKVFGSVVLNNFAFFEHSTYIEGGLGTAEERLPFRAPDCEALMQIYPGFFRIKESGIMAGADLSVSITDVTLDRWVDMIRGLAKEQEVESEGLFK
jgi:hypothetical protein